MIRIINLHGFQLKQGEVLIKVDRTSVLGNPFYMKDETQRNDVCDRYVTYFNTILEDRKAKENQVFLEELRRIYTIAKVQDVALGCWCAPKRCHAETIQKFLTPFLS